MNEPNVMAIHPIFKIFQSGGQTTVFVMLFMILYFIMSYLLTFNL